MVTWCSDKIITIKFSRTPRTETLNVTPNLSKDEIKEINKKPYRLLNTILVQILYKKQEHLFVIKRDYRWNGANIPFGLWNLIGSPSDNRFQIPSMIHDYLCEHHYVIDYDRQLSSIIFERLLAVAGVSPTKRKVMYLAVDNFQKFCGWNKKNKKEVKKKNGISKQTNR